MTAIAVPNRALADAERKLTLLLMEIRGTAPFEQVRLYVAKFTNGRLLSAYLNDDSVPPKERAALATALIEILLTKNYSRLPAIEPAAPPKPLPAATPTAATPQPADRGAQSPAEPHASSAAPRSDRDDDAPPAPDEIRAMIRAEVRRELATIFDIAARVLRES